MSTMSGDSGSFLGRCASALTHPVTVSAVVVLLLNDALFKSLWPDSWVTGKLSDLAWVVFASPLLAFVLSLFLGRSVFGRRAAIITAYVGLPALYAAFNTFEPVQDRILWGLSRVAGGTAGSPLDPSDSLVIPFGLGIAVWVLRRRPVSPDRLRVRLALLAAGVATFATVATSAPTPLTGIRSVGVAGDGAIMAAANDGRDRLQYSSSDGGLTWEPYSWPPNIVWGGQGVATPRGNFLIRGSDILVLTIEGDWVEVHSTTYLQGDANVWVQEQTTTRFGPRDIGTKPHSMAYDARSGNLIVAMGLQGVVVGSPDGNWSRVAVGDYSPTDFSFAGKTVVALSNLRLWVTTICLSLSMTAVSIVFALYRGEKSSLGIAATLAALALLRIIPDLLPAFEPNAVVMGIWIFHEILLPPLLVLGALALAAYLAFAPKDNSAARPAALAMGIIAAIASGATFRLFGTSDLAPPILVEIPLFVFLTLTMFCSIAAISFAWRQLKHRRSVFSAFAWMNGLVILVFLTWVQLGFGLTFAKISAFVLVALVAIALTNHLKRKQQPGGDGLDQGAKKI